MCAISKARIDLGWVFASGKTIRVWVLMVDLAAWFPELDCEPSIHLSCVFVTNYFMTKLVASCIWVLQQSLAYWRVQRLDLLCSHCRARLTTGIFFNHLRGECDPSLINLIPQCSYGISFEITNRTKEKKNALASKKKAWRLELEQALVRAQRPGPEKS